MKDDIVIGSSKAASGKDLSYQWIELSSLNQVTGKLFFKC